MKINTTVDVNQYTNQIKMLVEYIKKHEESVEELEKLLNSNDVKEFSLAVNYLVMLDYSNNVMCDEMKNMEYETKKELRELANKRVRKWFGNEFMHIFDTVVKESRQELWGGDELYKLYAGFYPPYYVLSCIKATLSVMAMMSKGIETIEDAVLLSQVIRGALYWTIYSEQENEKDGVATVKDRIVWRKMAAYLFEQKFEDAFNYMQAIMKKTDGGHFGDGFSSIPLEYIDEFTL